MSTTKVELFKRPEGWYFRAYGVLKGNLPLCIGPYQTELEAASEARRVVAADGDV